MTAGPSTHSRPDTRPLHRLVRRARRALRMSWIVIGVALTLALGLAALVTVTMVDLIAPLGHVLRVVGLALVIVPAAWAAVVGVVIPLFCQISAASVARRIEADLPNIHSRLVSCVDLDRADPAGASSAFHDRLISEALEHVRSYRPRHVIEARRLRRAGGLALLAIAAFVTCMLLLNARMPTAMARMFLPLRDIPPATGVTFDIMPGDTHVLRGDAVTIQAAVTMGSISEARLETIDDRGERTWRDMTGGGDGRWTLHLPQPDRSFTYRVHGGGTWSVMYTVDIVDRPRIVALQAAVHYPAYLGLTEPIVNHPQTAELTGPVGSTAWITVTTTGDATEGEIQLLRPSGAVTGVIDRAERPWFDGALPRDVTPSGEWTWDTTHRAHPAHTDPPSDAGAAHAFDGDATGFAVGRRDDVYVYVYLSPDDPPRAIAAAWYAAAHWEHRAFWGDDPYTHGAPNTAGRYRAGELPSPGRWARLDVPADAIDLRGRTLRGMRFETFGGRAWWGATGAIAAPPDRDDAFVVTDAIAMQRVEGERWTGQIEIHADGHYRIALRSALGYTNPTMSAARIQAVADHPPQAALTRPDRDLVLTQPRIVPLIVQAADDFGLADASVEVGHDGQTMRRLLKVYPPGTRRDTTVGELDLTTMGLTLGAHVSYTIELRDRKGQTARTTTRRVRIANDRSADDRQLEDYRAAGDAFQQALVDLQARQSDIQLEVDHIAGTLEPAKEADAATVESDPAEAAPESPDASEAATRIEELRAVESEPIEPLTPEQSKALAERLEALAQSQQNAADDGAAAAQALAEALAEAGQLSLLPPQFAEYMLAAHDRFTEQALDAMGDLADQLAQAAAQAGDRSEVSSEDIAALQQAAQRLQQQLEALQARSEAIGEAEDELLGDPADAVSQLEQRILEQDAQAAQAELSELHACLEQMCDGLGALTGDQEQLLDRTQQASGEQMAALRETQSELDDELDRQLSDVRELLSGDRPAQASEDTERPRDDKAKPPPSKYKPALGGGGPKPDPRIAERRRTPPQDDEEQTPAGRAALEDVQLDWLEELSLAQQSVSSDAESARKMRKQLTEVLRQVRSDGRKVEALSDWMQSSQMQQAMAMVDRMKAMQSGEDAGDDDGGETEQGSDVTMLVPIVGSGQSAAPPALESNDDWLGGPDPTGPAVILYMRPSVREQLLQGMQDKGPAGYERFVRNYFRRLSRIGQPK